MKKPLKPLRSQKLYTEAPNWLKKYCTFQWVVISNRVFFSRCRSHESFLWLLITWLRFANKYFSSWPLQDKTQEFPRTFQLLLSVFLSSGFYGEEQFYCSLLFTFFCVLTAAGHTLKWVESSRDLKKKKSNLKDFHEVFSPKFLKSLEKTWIRQKKRAENNFIFSRWTQNYHLTNHLAFKFFTTSVQNLSIIRGFLPKLTLLVF